MNQHTKYFTSILMFKTINKSSPNYPHTVIGLSMLKTNIKSTQDQPQMKTCPYPSYLPSLDKDFSSNEEYMLGTVYL